MAEPQRTPPSPAAGPRRRRPLVAAPRPSTGRKVAGIVAAALVAALGALILGEYEFKGTLPWVAGPLFGLVLGEVVIAAGKARDVVSAGCVAAFGFAGIVWAGWIDSTEGVEPVHSLVWVAAGLAAIVGYVRTAGLHPSHRSG